MDLQKHILEKIDFLCCEKSLSKFKLTELAGLSENTIYNWYNKGAMPSLFALQSVCNVLEVSLLELFTLNDIEQLSVQETGLVKAFRLLNDNQRILILSLVNELVG